LKLAAVAPVEVSIASFERLLENGPLSRADVAALDRVRPHLARAAALSARLQMEQARAMAQTLAAVGLAAAVLARNGRLMAANALLEEMGQVRFLSRDRFAFVDESAQMLLTSALAGMESGNDEVVKSIPLRGKDESPPSVAHLLPIKGAAHDLFSRAEALLIVTPLTASRMTDDSILSGLFDLTAAESRLARGLLEGLTLKEVARRLGLSVQTLRSQLKTVFDKTGAHRQVELITLLGKAAR
jgi:DNA-binding CsgD family transcriptional regulator